MFDNQQQLLRRKTTSNSWPPVSPFGYNANLQNFYQRGRPLAHQVPRSAPQRKVLVKHLAYAHGMFPERKPRIPTPILKKPHTRSAHKKKVFISETITPAKVTPPTQTPHGNIALLNDMCTNLIRQQSALQSRIDYQEAEIESLKRATPKIMERRQSSQISYFKDEIDKVLGIQWDNSVLETPNAPKILKTSPVRAKRFPKDFFSNAIFKRL